MREQLELLPDLLTAHLQLTLVALAIGLAASVPLGIWLTRRPRLERLVMGVVGALQTIPSLALLAIMVPLLAALGAFSESTFGLGLRSIGYLPAVIALTIYSLLPILRNTVTGIEGVDPALVEAARAVGMTSRERLVRVELPLAMPVIAAGLRTAAVWVVGTATLSTPVGAPSLGNYIFSGLQTRNFSAVLVGCVAAAALALLLDALIRQLEIGLRDRRRGPLIVSGLLLAALALFSVGSLAAGAWQRGDAPRVVIGCKNFSEQYILSEAMAQLLEERIAAETEVVQSLGSTVVFDALAGGEIDAYVEYSGTLWATVMKRSSAGIGREEVLTEVAEFLEVEHGILLLGSLGFENAYALAMREDRAAELGLESISDLVRAAGELEMGADYEFFSRSEWRDLEAGYGLAFRARRNMDPSLMYQAVANGEVDVISAFSTDGRIAAFGLRLLEDDLGIIPPYDAIVLVGERLRRREDAVAALGELVGALDERRMQELNMAVDRDGRLPAEVARELVAGLGSG